MILYYFIQKRVRAFRQLRNQTAERYSIDFREAKPLGEGALHPIFL
jgi:hypothetical protein